jgi:acetyltransferase-like isoleucine patch superfamily enzyme
MFIIKTKNKLKNFIITYQLKLKNKGINKSVRFKEAANITIGKKCNIGANSYIYCWNEYQHGSTKQNLKGTIFIGNNFNATRALTIQCCQKISIGNDVLIASNVFICDYNHGIQNLEIPYLNNELFLAEVIIEDGVWIGQGASILAGVHIGKKSIIGAGSIVTKNIPEYSIAVGNPAKIIKKYDFNLLKWIDIE